MMKPVNLAELVDTISWNDPEATMFYNGTTGEFFRLDEYYDRIWWDEDKDVWLQRNESDQKSLQEVDDFHNSEDEYISLPTQYDVNEYGMMEDFIDDFTGDRRIAEDLAYAIGGRGAFRRFRDQLERHGIEEQWYAYKDAAYLRFARKWCEEHEVPYVE